MISLIVIIPAGYYIFVELVGLLRDIGLFSQSIVDLPEITSTFWVTDDVYLFGLEDQQMKMITFSAIILNTWLGVPFMMVSFLAALQNIPPELYEAADIDGSNGWQKFKKITFPLIKPTLFTVSLLGFVWTFNLFNVVYLLTENQTGIGDSKYYAIFVTYIYRLFDTDRLYSKAAAMSFVVFLLLITISTVYNKIIDIDKMFVGEEGIEDDEQDIIMKGTRRSANVDIHKILGNSEVQQTDTGEDDI